MSKYIIIYLIREVAFCAGAFPSCRVRTLTFARVRFKYGQRGSRMGSLCYIDYFSSYTLPFLER